MCLYDSVGLRTVVCAHHQPGGRAQCGRDSAHHQSLLQPPAAVPGGTGGRLTHRGRVSASLTSRKYNCTYRLASVQLHLPSRFSTTACCLTSIQLQLLSHIIYEF